MVWCPSCSRNCEQPGFDNGFLCCSYCGRVINEDNFSNEPTFVKNAGGQSQLSGNFVRTVQSDYSASRDRTLTNAFRDMDDMVTGMQMGDNRDFVTTALAFYTIAVERNFTRGRRKEQVEAACLYIACREKKMAFLLIEFSDYLRINVYELGAVFLQLCKLLSLEEHPIVQKPVDPSLFIHRFSERLLGRRNNDVMRTALRIIASMKRDWMQTGRKPSGLCGAALYISALSYGLKCSKSEVIRVVHICEATLTKRLIEFENTESGSLTIEEFNMKAEELEREYRSAKQPNIGSNVSGTSELLCEHKGSEKPSFAHGLCESCYDDFIKLSGGLEGGSAPPAFQRAEQERMRKESTEESANNSNFVTMPCNLRNSSKDLNTPFEKESNIPNVIVNENLQFSDPKSTGTATEHVAIGEGAHDKLHGIDGMSATACDESESLSDIDDVEVDGYLHNEEEKRYKKIIWEEMNREYLEEQAAKEAATAAAKEAFQANLHNCPEDVQAAQELAAAAAAAVAKSRKEKQQKRAAEARNSVPAQTAAEATREMLTKKRLSSKINYDVLEKLFDDSVAPENPKKSRTGTHLDNDDNLRRIGKKELESEDTYKNGDLGPEDEYEDVGDTEGAYDKDLYYENVDEGYAYDDDYGYDGY
uniref:Putative transcription factor IIIB subunit n=1 Tax=Davidia involucrata TaxID=16924 RepID=A0A5B7B987_DAVIN